MTEEIHFRTATHASSALQFTKGLHYMMSLFLKGQMDYQVSLLGLYSIQNMHHLSDVQFEIITGP
jgi:hypothetical protein